MAVWILSGFAATAPCNSEVRQSAPEIVQECMNKSLDPVYVVDVRSPQIYAAEHIAGAVNVPVAAIEGHNFAAGKQIVLYCSATGCPLSERAATILTARGYTDVAILAGGIEAWRAKGFAVASNTAPATVEKAGGDIHVGRVSAFELAADRSGAIYLVIDVRSATEFAAGHIPGAINIPAAALLSTVAGKGKDIVVYARSVGSAGDAVRQLAKAGVKAYELTGGLQLWAAQGLPMVAGDGSGVK